MSENIRGVVECEVCGRKVTLAPTYRAIDNIESRLAVGIPALLRRTLSGDVRIRDFAVIVHEGLRGAGHTGRNGEGDMFAIEAIGEDIMSRFGDYAVAVGEFLANAMGGPIKKNDVPASMPSATASSPTH